MNKNWDYISMRDIEVGLWNRHINLWPLNWAIECQSIKKKPILEKPEFLEMVHSEKMAGLYLLYGHYFGLQHSLKD